MAIPMGLLRLARAKSFSPLVARLAFGAAAGGATGALLDSQSRVRGMLKGAAVGMGASYAYNFFGEMGSMVASGPKNKVMARQIWSSPKGVKSKGHGVGFVMENRVATTGKYGPTQTLNIENPVRQLSGHRVKRGVGAWAESIGGAYGPHKSGLSKRFGGLRAIHNRTINRMSR